MKSNAEQRNTKPMDNQKNRAPNVFNDLKSF